MIREATVRDIPRLVDMGTRFVQQTEYAAHVPVNPGQMARTAEWLIESETGTVLVAEKDGRLVGMLGLTHFTHPLSGLPTTGELFWWSESPGEGLRLLKRGEQWAREQGAITMQMIAPNERVGAVYERLKYQRTETNYQRSL